MSKKAGLELTTSTIIVLVLLLLVLVIVILIATGALGTFGKNIIVKIKTALGLFNSSMNSLPK